MANENPYRKYVPQQPVQAAPPRGGFIPDPYAIPQAQADLQRTQTQTAVDAAALPYAGDIAAAQRDKAIADAAKAQAETATTLDERTSGLSKQEQRLSQSLESIGGVISTINKVREAIRLGKNVTGWGGTLASLPGTSARSVRNDLDTIRSNLTFDKLQNIRDNSPTGGAVGNASDADMRLLGSTVANLDNLASADDVLDALDRIERHYARFVVNLKGFDPDSEAGRNEIVRSYGEGTLDLGDPGSRMPSGINPALTGEQQRMIDAFYRANPNFTADQLRGFVQSIGAPDIANVDEIVAARDAGRGVAPAALAREAGPGQGPLTQGLSGVNEGIAAALGLPIDALTGGVNAVGSGMNWLNETFGGDPRANLPRIENPVGGGQWFRENMLAPTIGPSPNTGQGQFWRRAGQSLGAASVPGGFARTPGAVASALMSGAGGGLGAATMQEQFPGNQWAEMGGDVVGALLAGGPAAAISTNVARNEARAAVPTVDKLKEQAGRLYDQAEARGIVAGADVTTALADSMTEIARREALLSAKGRVSEQYTKLGPVLQTLQDEAGQLVSPKRIQVLRETLADAAYSAEGKEQKIALDMLRAFDDVTVPLAPELAEARDVASRYLQSAPIDEAIRQADLASHGFSQSGLDNALRIQFKNLSSRDIKGHEYFTPEASDAIAGVAKPTGLRAAGRWGGRFSPESGFGLLLGGAPAGAGIAASEPVLGGLVGGSLYAGGWGSRKVADTLALRQANDAALMARSGGTMDLPSMLDVPATDAVAAALAAQGTVALTDEDALRDAEIVRLLSQAQFAQ